MAYTNASVNNSPVIVEKVASTVTDAVDMRGKAVKYDTDGDVVLASAAGEVVMGIALLTNDETVRAGMDVDIQIRYNGMAVAGGEVAKGDPLAAGADGKLVKAASGQFVIATALEAATAADRIIRIAITRYTA